jgi:hypothetical protein
VQSPIPTRRSGLSGTSLKRLPAWVVAQYGATRRYLAPSYGQHRVLRALAPVGLTPRGFHIPRNWGPAPLQALQQGYVQGQQNLSAVISNQKASPSTNY